MYRQTDATNNKPSATNNFSEEQAVLRNANTPSHDAAPTYQDDQMGSVPHPLLDLHHSADNHQPSPDEVTLTYPSGHSERFSFSRRIQKREHKYARTLRPDEDLITTIEVLCIQLGINKDNELQFKRRILEVAFKNHKDLATVNLPSLQTIIHNLCGWKRGMKLQRFDCVLRPELVEHFFDQLHDRSIADVASLLERTGEKSTDSTYGELTPQFLSAIFLETGLSKSCIYLDLGSGVGQTCMQASLETQCTSFGVEREGKCHTVAMTHLDQFKTRSVLWGLKHGDVHLRKGDFLVSTFMDELLPQADVVLVNNLVLGPETDLALTGRMIKSLKSGAQVVSTRPLTPIKRAARARKGARSRRPNVEKTTAGDEELVERDGEDTDWTWKQRVFAAGSVSWSHKEGLYYISIKK